MNTEEKRKFKKLLPSLQRKLANIHKALTGRYIPVSNVEMPDAIGYTSANRTIHISEDNVFLDKLSLEESVSFYRGVDCHELMHQLMTNFKLLDTLNTYPSSERNIFAEIVNIVEDPRIENFVSNYVGGSMVKDLNYTKVVIYRNSEKLEESKYAYQQFIMACIQYGDMGLLKGNFTFPEAKDIFYKILPLFDSAICEPNCKKAFNIAIQIGELARPLWQDEADFNQMIEDIKKKLSEMGKLGGNPGTSAIKPNSKMKPENSRANSNRKITRKKITQEQLDEMKKNGQITDNPSKLGDGDITILEVENGSETKSDDSNGANGSGSSENSDDSENSTNGANGSGSSENSDDSESSNDSNDSNSSKSSSSSESSGKSDTNGKTPKELARTARNNDDFTDYNEAVNEIDNYTLSEDDIADVDKDIESYINQIGNDKAENVDNTVPLDIPDIDSRYFKNAKCINVNITSTEESEQKYNKLVQSIGSSLTLMTNQFKRLFRNKVEEKEHCASGKINLYRLNNGRVSSRVFDKRRSPTNKADFAIAIAIDESGSMSGNNISCARITAVGIAEMCAKLDIPLYVMGFTTDNYNGNRYDAVQRHYIKWKNNKAARRNLLSLDSYCCNFDGYAVRYMDRILSKRQEANRLLIVISDGTPSASIYRGCDAGVADTKNAVKEANKHNTVLGVAIDSADKEALKEIYGTNFLYVPNTQELFKKIGNKLLKIMKE